MEFRWGCSVGNEPFIMCVCLCSLQDCRTDHILLHVTLSSAASHGMKGRTSAQYGACRGCMSPTLQAAPPKNAKAKGSKGKK